MKLNSLKFKISVLSLLVLAFFLVVHSVILFTSFRYTLYQELESGLQAKAQKIHNAIVSYLDVLGYDTNSFEFSVKRVISQTGSHPHENKIQKLEQLWLGQARPLGIDDDFILFLDPKGRAIARSRTVGVQVPPVSEKDIRNALQRGQSVFRRSRIAGKPYHAVLIPVTYYKLPRERTFLIWVATSRQGIIHELRTRLFQHGIGIAVILAIAALMSQLFVRSILKPIRDITWTAKNINYKDLSMRIKTDQVDDEMKDLVGALNEMISRLEKSFKYIAEFSSHVSHELKTPLAILRGESELALRSEQTAEEYRAMIRTNLEEIVRMTKIIEDLLLMTKLDYQPGIFRFQNIDLGEFFGEIADSMHILAEPKDLRVDVELPKETLTVYGDGTHLRRLFFNLINNAIKFTDKGSIGLRVQKVDRDVRISISDTGIGIPEENLKKVFDKFFHVDDREKETLGNGLGLSIAQTIAKVHGGNISVESTMGKGSVFVVRLPLSAY